MIKIFKEFKLTLSILSNMPKDVKDLLKEYSTDIYVGGGFLRDSYLKIKPNDIDLFISPLSDVDKVKEYFESKGYSSFTTNNAISFTKKGVIKIQLIIGWKYSCCQEMWKDFDFTINQIGFYYNGSYFIIEYNDTSLEDIKHRRLVYTNPIRKETSLDAIYRMVKFLHRGYTIDEDNLAKVLARSLSFTGNINKEDYTPNYKVESEFYDRILTTRCNTKSGGGYLND